MEFVAPPADLSGIYQQQREWFCNAYASLRPKLQAQILRNKDGHTGAQCEAPIGKLECEALEYLVRLVDKDPMDSSITWEEREVERASAQLHAVCIANESFASDVASDAMTANKKRDITILCGLSVMWEMRRLTADHARFVASGLSTSR